MTSGDSYTPSLKLLALAKKARKGRVTPAQLEEQRRSFAYGNARLEDEGVTRDEVEDVANTMPLNPAR